MLFELGLTNFKPFGSYQRARLAPITLIYGPNSGGKSSVIQALMLLKQTMVGSAGTTSLIPRGSLVDLGSYRALVHRHDLDRSLAMRLTFGAGSSRDRAYYGPTISRDYMRMVELTYKSVSSTRTKRRDSSELAQVQYRLKALDSKPHLDIRLSRSARVLERDTLFAPIDVKGETGFFVLSDAAAQRSLASYFWESARLNQSQRPDRERVRGSDLPELAEFIDVLQDALVFADGGIPARLVPQLQSREDRNRLAHQNDRDRALQMLFRGPRFRVIEGIARECTQIVDSLSYLGPLRSSPERHYVVHGGTPSSVGKRGEFTSQMLYRRKKALTGEVNDWFKRFDIPYHLSIKELEDEITGAIIVMSLEDQRTNVTVAPSDVGFGIGQLLPILVEGLVADDRIICVEQPEIHLHPRLQANLADFFIETAGVAMRDENRRTNANQWIVETHSEALILRIQKHVRAGKLKADSVSVLYVEPGAQGSTISQLRLDDDGEFIDSWPHGFFEERFDDLFGATP